MIKILRLPRTVENCFESMFAGWVIDTSMDDVELEEPPAELEELMEDDVALAYDVEDVSIQILDQKIRILGHFGCPAAFGHL